jgi:putative heme-binding domain-containing protein
LDPDPLLETLARLASVPDPLVRFQLALTLGARPGPRAGAILSGLAGDELADDPWIRAAILSAAPHQSAPILRAVLETDPLKSGRSEFISQLIATAVGESDPESLSQAINAITQAKTNEAAPWRLAAATSLVEALNREHLSLAELAKSPQPAARKAAAGLQPLFEQARLLALAPDTEDFLREPAIRLLGRDPQSHAQDLQTLSKLLNRPLSTGAQQAVLDALTRTRGPETADLLLADWNVRPPSLRQASLTVLLSREEWITPLLAALEHGTVGRAEISNADRQRLRHFSNSSIQRRSEALWPAKPAGRAEVLASFQKVNGLTGDSANGAVIFGKTCATCHALRGQGHAVGPNLAPLADKTPADFLIAILDPNAAVEPRFLAYNIETRDGRALSGIVSAETSTSLTLVQPGGIQENILRGDLREIRASGLSLMPEGLEQNLTGQDLADLIAYLKTGPRSFGGASPQQAEAARKQFLAGGANGVGKLIAAMDQIPYASWIGALPMPYCRQLDGQGRLEWQTKPVPLDLKRDAGFDFRLPAAMGLVSDPAGKFTLRLNGKAVLDFNVSLTDQSWQSLDGKVRMTYTVQENNAEDSNGVLAISVAPELLEPGQPATFTVTGSASKSQRWFGVYLAENAAGR